MKLQAIQDKIIVDPINSEKELESGLVFTKDEIPQKGIVVSAGLGRKDEDMHLKEGDVILFPRHAGGSIDVGTPESPKRYLILTQNSVHCKVIEE